jgi:hypothetical protein
VVSDVKPDAAWARAHKANYEVEPLLEMVDGHRAQVGYVLTLYARLPREEGPGAERRAHIGELMGNLRAILESLAPPPGGAGRLELEPPRAAAFMTPDMEMEFAASARVFHGAKYFEAVSKEDEKLVHEEVRRLAEKGLVDRKSMKR